MHALRLQEEEDRKKAMEPFSFQGQIDTKVKEMKKMTALQFQARPGAMHPQLQLFQYLMRAECILIPCGS